MGRECRREALDARREITVVVGEEDAHGVRESKVTPAPLSGACVAGDYSVRIAEAR